MDILILFVSLGLILGAAEFFTNAIEWLGCRLGLSEGAVGSILAAVGTALPETMIPIIAIFLGTGGEAYDIGIGAILGAPFMLGTLGMFVNGAAGLKFSVEGKKRNKMLINNEVVQRDLSYFVLVYSIAILAALVPFKWARIIITLFLVSAYVYYVYKTLNSGDETGDENLSPLYCARHAKEPSLFWIVLQVILALAGIVTGAHFFVDAIKDLAIQLGIPAFILSLVIAPIATELPEKFNSIIWVRQGKDTLAMGNITGAMVFQSTLIPTFGILFTPWKLSPLAFFSAILVLAYVAYLVLTLKTKGYIKPVKLLYGGAFYLLFLLGIFAFELLA